MGNCFFGLKYQKGAFAFLALTCALCCLLLIGLTGCGGSSESSKPESTSASAPAPAEKEQITMPDVSGMVASDARDALDKAGFTNVSFDSDSGKGVYDYTNWTVIAQDPIASTACEPDAAVKITVKKTEEITKEQIENVVGKPIAEANEALTALGYTITYVHSETGMDFTSEALTDGIDWVVVDCADVDSDKKTVTLKIVSAEQAAAQLEQASMEATLKAKLDPQYAWQAVADYGEREYVYGFDLHWIMDPQAETAVDENTWFLKASCTVKNAYGTKASMICEAQVTGTTENPQVVEFLVY